MAERDLRLIGAGLLLAGAAALGLQVLISLEWVPGALPFILFVSGPQLAAGVWVLLPLGSRRAVLYLPAILLGVYVAYWNAAVIAEAADVTDVPQLVVASLLLLLGVQVVFPLLAGAALGLAWRDGRRSVRGTPTAERVESTQVPGGSA